MSTTSFSHTMAERGFTRFVLLRPRETACPDDLAESFRGRWHLVTQVFDPLNALAEICVVDRAEHPRRQWGLSPQEKVALIVVDQQYWSSFMEMLSIIKSRLAAISVWNYTDNLIVEIAGQREQPVKDPQQQEKTAGPSSGKVRKSYGTLRLTGTYEEDAPQAPEPSTQESDESNATEESTPNVESDDQRAREPHSVSAEELEMLLGLLDEDTGETKTDSRDDEDQERKQRKDQH